MKSLFNEFKQFVARGNVIDLAVGVIMGAAFTAWYNGLTTAGIMDHDSVAGADEFIRAAKEMGIAATVGFECRVQMNTTPFAGRRINNPDQDGVAYVACHGIPHQSIAGAEAFLAPYREKRNTRNRAMVAKINLLLAGSGIALDFERDVLTLSQNPAGGSVTERHILYALALAIVGACGAGQPVVAFLQKQFGLKAEGKALAGLQNARAADYAYTLLGVLKGGFVEQFYIPATDECPDVSAFLEFTRGIGAVPAYAYLGDVGDSVTGDKKAQAFEDSYLDDLVPWLAGAGFLALTYMPTRNTPAQLARLMALCDENSLFQISGEDINSPAQSFICEALRLPQYRHLVTNTWALIGHEQAATAHVEDGMFSATTINAMPGLRERIAYFAKLAHDGENGHSPL